MENNQVTVFECGPPTDHECDSDGPVMCGGERDGEYWEAVETPESRKGATWGSVSCSKCKRTAMEVSMWRGDWS